MSGTNTDAQASDAAWATAAAADMPHLRPGHSVFAELARERGLFDSQPAHAPVPNFVTGPDGMAAKFDQAVVDNAAGYCADKVTLADWHRRANARTFSTVADGRDAA